VGSKKPSQGRYGRRVHIRSERALERQGEYRMVYLGIAVAIVGGILGFVVFIRELRGKK
jgi:hypothetical protein